jgi:hypothetical protein
MVALVPGGNIKPVVYYESIKRELKTRPIYECRYDERLKTKSEESEMFVYYESIKRELKTRPIYECRCDERLKPKAEESTRLVYTGLLGELEHLKIETRNLHTSHTLGGSRFWFSVQS